MTTPVSIQPLAGSNFLIVERLGAVDQIEPHQMPSLNHSLLCGFSPDGAVGWLTPGVREVLRPDDAASAALGSDGHREQRDRDDG